MLSSEYHDRFLGVTRLYGQTAAAAFARAHVCVVGIGGVGSWAAESLARSGIAALTLIDLDDICLNNTNRQAHTLSSTVGKLKAEVMAERIKLINPFCRVTVRADFFTESTAAKLFELEAVNHEDALNYSAVVDAIDSLKNKALLIAECLKRNIPVVTSGGAGGRKNPNCLKTSALNTSQGDPLLKSLRRELRHAHGLNDAQLAAVQAAYSTETPAPLVCSSEAQPRGKLDCANGFGTVMHITAGLGLQLSYLVLEQLPKRAAQLLPC